MCYQRRLVKKICFCEGLIETLLCTFTTEECFYKNSKLSEIKPLYFFLIL